MFTLTHTIAGIIFQTDSDVEITSIQNSLFQEFLTDGSEPDVHHRFFGIDHTDLTLPPVSEDERRRISRCMSPPYLGPGTLTLPPLIDMEEKDGPFRHVSLSQDGEDVPLLQSPTVRTRLESCFSHPEQVSLTLHIFSIVIHDYFHKTIDVFYPTERRVMFEGHWVENGLRRMFTSFLPAFSAVMVHSSGLILDGKAALFLSPDEGGKSTVLECASDGVALCDDRNILRQEEDGFFVYGTPWGRITNASQRARIGGIFLLEKAPDFELIRIKPRDALQFLWDEHIHSWRILPRNLRTRAFEVLYDACHQTPAYQMRFPKDYVDWGAIDAAMAG